MLRRGMPAWKPPKWFLVTLSRVGWVSGTFVYNLNLEPMWCPSHFGKHWSIPSHLCYKKLKLGKEWMWIRVTYSRNSWVSLNQKNTRRQGISRNALISLEKNAHIKDGEKITRKRQLPWAQCLPQYKAHSTRGREEKQFCQFAEQEIFLLPFSSKIPSHQTADSFSLPSKHLWLLRGANGG